jgi:hypothetical protein
MFKGEFKHGLKQGVGVWRSGKGTQVS